MSDQVETDDPVLEQEVEHAVQEDVRARIKAILDRMPDQDVRGALDNLAKDNPVLWTMYKRRLRNMPLVFDVSHYLTADQLDKAKRDLADEKRYAAHLKILLLRHRPFLIDPLRDEHPYKVYEKGRQVGVSEVALMEEMDFLDTKSEPGNPRRWIHTFPREKQLLDFANTRIAEALNETPRTRQLLTGVDQTTLKQIGHGQLFLRSAWESNLGEGIDADGVTFDEKDRMKKNIEQAFKGSLDSSPYGWIREVSTPTLPGEGVDKTYLKSDQRTWLVRCSRCNLPQEIEWPENFQQVKDYPIGAQEIPAGSWRYCCRKSSCKGDLDRLHGEWVVKYRDRLNYRGYHIPQTIAPWKGATDLIQRKIEYQYLQLWLNYCLGRPAKSDSVFLTEQDFLQASAPGLDLYTRRTADWDSISVGIDWGYLNWVTVTARNVHNMLPYIIGLAVFEDDQAQPLLAAKAVESYIAPFNPDIIIPDFGYGRDRNAYLIQKFGVGRVFACLYNPATKGDRTFQPVWSADEGARVLVSRTVQVKGTCRAIKLRQLGVPDIEHPMVQLLKDHFRALMPVMQEEDGEIIEDIGSVGPDHLAHSSVYSFLGYDRITRGRHFNFSFGGD